MEQRTISRRIRKASSVTERELSQLAAGGQTRDGWDDFKVGLPGGVLRFGTNRAPLIAEFLVEHAVGETRFREF